MRLHPIGKFVPQRFRLLKQELVLRLQIAIWVGERTSETTEVIAVIVVSFTHIILPNFLFLVLR